MNDFTIKTCPVCGSKRVRQVTRDITSKRGGTPYCAHDIQVEECPNCGEIFFSPEALKSISAQQPKARSSAAVSKPHKVLRRPRRATSAG